MSDRSSPPDNALLMAMSFDELRKSIATAHEALQRLSAFQLFGGGHTDPAVHEMGQQSQQTNELQLAGVPAPAADGLLASGEVANRIVDGACAPEQIERPSGNTIDPPADRWYAVTVGRNPGVVRGVHNLVPNTSGIPGAAVQRYSSEKSATAAYHEALKAGQVVRVQLATRCTLVVISDDESESDGQDS